MHYLSKIQEARHTAERLVELRDELPADLITSQLAGAKRNLIEGEAMLAALPASKLRGGVVYTDMRARAVAAIAKLEG